MDRKKKFIVGLTLTGILTIGGLVNPIILENTRVKASSASGSIPIQEKDIFSYLQSAMLDYYQKEKQEVEANIESLKQEEEIYQKSQLNKIKEQRYDAVLVYNEEKKKSSTKAKQIYNKKLEAIETEQTKIVNRFEKKITELNETKNKAFLSIGKEMEYNISSMQKEESKKITMNSGTDEIKNNINLINKAVKYKKQAIQLNFDNDIKNKETEIKILGLTTNLEKDKWNFQLKKGTISKTAIKNKISHLESTEKIERIRLTGVISTMEKEKNNQLQNLFNLQNKAIKELEIKLK